MNRSVASHVEIARRYIVLLATCLWFGGFTFYSLVVIHTGHDVFDSRLETGFLTQKVTGWLNFIGVITLFLLLWNTVVSWRDRAVWLRWLLVAMWVVMAGVECWLFRLHPALDQMLNSETHKILDREHFRTVHDFYVNLSTVQWCATLVYIWASLLAWKNSDSRMLPANSQ
jgi:hypothetical protein